MITCAVCCVTGMLNHNLPLVFHPDTVFSAPSSSFITTNPWLVCLLQPHSLYPMHRPRVLPSPHFHLNCYTECFLRGGGGQLDTSWSHLGRGILSQGIIFNQIDPWTSLCVIFLVDDWYWWVAPSLGRWTWDGCMRNLAERRQENKQVSSLSMVPTSATAWVPALTSLCDGLWWSHVSQISSFFPKLLLAIAEKQTIIFAYCFV